MIKPPQPHIRVSRLRGSRDYSRRARLAPRYGALYYNENSHGIVTRLPGFSSQFFFDMSRRLQSCDSSTGSRLDSWRLQSTHQARIRRWQRRFALSKKCLKTSSRLFFPFVQLTFFFNEGSTRVGSQQPQSLRAAASGAQSWWEQSHQSFLLRLRFESQVAFFLLALSMGVFKKMVM